MPRLFIILLCLLIPAGIAAQEKTNPVGSVIGTYSIVAWDSVTGDLGVAVQSKFLGVGAVVPYAKAGVGAIATQAFANTTFGPQGLDMLERGMDAQQVVEALIKMDSLANQRQLGIVDARGNSFAYTGSQCMKYAGHMTGRGYSVQGNILAGEGVLKAMARTFEITAGDIAERLLSALEAAEKAGGDSRGRQSAALLVVRNKGGYAGYNDRFVDIRVDDDSLPLVELRRIFKLWEGTFLLEARLRTIQEFERDKKYTAAQEEMKRAIESLNLAVRNKPDDPELLNDVARTLATYDIDRERALVLAKRAAVLAPDKLHILSTMAECHYRLGHFDEAIAIAAELVKKNPASDDYWKQLQKFKEAKDKSGR